MSSIDNRVVAMKFDNKDFKKGANDTLKALGELDKSLLLKNGAKGFSDIQKASNSVSLEGLAGSVSGIESRFQGLQAVALGALATIGAKAVDVGLQMGQEMFRSAREGFAEYELQLNSVQTILANTQAAGTTLDDVNASLDRMNTYADQTIYNFQEMARNIGTFTAAGVGLETSEAAIKGIANLAALSGSNSQQASTAMYQLSQAISAGRVSLMDWNSVVNAGMGGTVFQRALAETAVAMGKIDESALSLEGKMKNVKIEGQSFRDSISGGDSWLDTDVLTAALSQFTGDLTDAELAAQGFSDAQIEAIQKQAETAQNAATQVKTFTQLMETTQEAMGSGWAQTWAILFGDLESARDMWTGVSEALNVVIEGQSKARNELLRGWDELGARQRLIDALGNAFQNFGKIASAIGDVWNEIFPPATSKQLAAITDAVADFLNGFQATEEVLSVVQNVARGVFTVLKGGVSVLKTVFDIIGFGVSVLWQVGRVVGSIVGDIFEFGYALGRTLLTPIIELVEYLGSFNFSLDNVSKGLSGVIDSIIEFKDRGVEPAIDAVKGWGDAVQKYFTDGAGTKIFEALGSAIEWCADVIQNFKDVWSETFSAVDVDTSGVAKAANGVAGAWESVVNFFKVIWEFLEPAIKAVGDFFRPLMNWIGELVGGMNIMEIMMAVNAGVFAKFLWEVGGFIKEGKGIFGGFNGIVESLGDGLESLGDVFNRTDSIPTAALKLGGALLLFAASLLLLVPAVEGLAALDWNELAKGLTGLAGAMALLVAGALILGKWGGSMLRTAASLVILAWALNIMAGAIEKMSGLSWNEIAKGLTAVGGALGLLVGAVIILGRFGSSMITGAIAITAMAGALSLLAGAVSLLSLLSWEQLAKGGTAVAGMLIFMVGAFTVLSMAQKGILKGSIALMLMAAAINALTVPMLALAIIPWDVLLKGMGAVGIMIAGLSIAMLTLGARSKQTMAGAISLVMMAGAINTLALAIVGLGLMDTGSLIQGLIAVAVAMGILVGAANLMRTAVAGAGAMVLMAGAILILSGAIAVMAAIPVGNLFAAIGALALLIAVLVGASAIISAFAVPALILAGVLLALSIAMIAVSASMLIFAAAAAGVAGGLLLLGEAAKNSAGAILPLIGIGAALIVFGAGLVVVGAAVVVLGLGLVVLGVGLGIIGLTGPLAAAALLALAEAMSQMVEHIGAMLGVSAVLLVLSVTLAVLGASMLIFGAGLLVVAAGAILLAAAFAIVTASLAIFATIGPQAIMQFMMFLQQLIALIPVFAASVAQAFVSFIEVIASNAERIKTAAVTIIKSILQGFRETIPEVVKTLVDMLSTLLEKIAEKIPEFVTKGIEMIVNLINGIANQIGPLAQAGANAIIALLDAIGNEVPRIADHGVTMVEKLMDSIAKEVPRLLDAGARMIIDMLNGIASTIRNRSAEMRAAGANVASALIDGMTGGIFSGLSRVTSAIGSMASNAIATAKSVFGINSPSKVFNQFGRYIDEGLALGIDDGTADVDKSMGRLGSTTVKQFSKIVDSVARSAQDMDISSNPTITPVLDLSEVARGARGIDSLLVPSNIDVSGEYNAASAISSSRRSAEEESLDTEDRRGNGDTHINFTQTNTSPKALSERDIYRNTQSQMALARESLRTR